MGKREKEREIGGAWGTMRFLFPSQCPQCAFFFPSSQSPSAFFSPLPILQPTRKRRTKESYAHGEERERSDYKIPSKIDYEQTFLFFFKDSRMSTIQEWHDLSSEGKKGDCSWSASKSFGHSQGLQQSPGFLGTGAYHTNKNLYINSFATKL